jgi:group I intron endonuclease
MGYIYLITNKINGKKYVGQTQQLDINERWCEHKKVSEHTLGRYILNAYKKHGIENFKFQIVCICFDSDCNIYEEYYIKKFDCLAPNGYNLMSGGKNFKHHPDTLKKMSESIKAYKKLHPQVCSEETRKKLSESRKGEKNPNFNKPMSEEQKQKISESRKKLIKEGKLNINKGIKITEKQLEGLKKGWEISKEKTSKKVGKYDLEGKLLATYESISEAGRREDILYQSICKVCKGKYKTAGGFIWKYITD